MQEIKSSGLAIVLSFFWPGLGQLYAGRIPRGLLIMAATPFVWGLGWVGGCGALGSVVVASHSPGHAASGGVVSILLAMLAFGWWVWGMFDSKRICEQHNSGTFRPAAG